mmetsp:Transcript_116717/g.324479  ORF Transcript_116717/g.324479 Transcript_116717/m.324479 type:complete len:278 (+) Transcript_116717:347-1180(+)
MRIAHGFELGQQVVWTAYGVGDDIPEGSIGTVRGFTLHQVLVRFVSGEWLFPRVELRAATEDQIDARLCGKALKGVGGDRCEAEAMWARYRIKAYAYVQHSEADFKQALLDGPFYTSFMMYSDFEDFFEQFPTHAYSRPADSDEEQWGGHAVTTVGWEADCVCHAKGESDPRCRGAAADGKRWLGRAPCWIMRNQWGADWADEGYFRMRLDVLTPGEGDDAHDHLASVQGIGPFEVPESEVASSVSGGGRSRSAARGPRPAAAAASAACFAAAVRLL